MKHSVLDFPKKETPCWLTIPAIVVGTLTFALCLGFSGAKGVNWFLLPILFGPAYMAIQMKTLYALAKWTRPYNAVAFMKAFSVVAMVGCLPLLAGIGHTVDDLIGI